MSSKGSFSESEDDSPDRGFDLGIDLVTLCEFDLHVRYFAAELSSSLECGLLAKSRASEPFNVFGQFRFLCLSLSESSSSNMLGLARCLLDALRRRGSIEGSDADFDIGSVYSCVDVLGASLSPR